MRILLCVELGEGGQSMTRERSVGSSLISSLGLSTFNYSLGYLTPTKVHHRYQPLCTALTWLKDDFQGFK